jgi:hypothetical protein
MLGAGLPVALWLGSLTGVVLVAVVAGFGSACFGIGYSFLSSRGIAIWKKPGEEDQGRLP